MTSNRAAKRAARIRQAKTGEPYMEARRQSFRAAVQNDPLDGLVALDWEDALMVAGYTSRLSHGLNIAGPTLSPSGEYALFEITRTGVTDVFATVPNNEVTVAAHVGVRRLEVEYASPSRLHIGIPLNPVLRGQRSITDPMVTAPEAAAAVTHVVRDLQSRAGSAQWRPGAAERMVDTPEVAAWVVRFDTPAGPPADWFRDNLAEDLAYELGAEVRVETDGYDAALTIFRDEQDLPDDARQRMHKLGVDDLWRKRWSRAGLTWPTPRPQHNVYEEAALGDATWCRQPFVIRSDMRLHQAFAYESALREQIPAGHFALVPFVGHDGKRHPQALVAAWSDLPLPETSVALPAGGAGNALLWALDAMLKKAVLDHGIVTYDAVAVETNDDGWALKIRLHDRSSSDAFDVHRLEAVGVTGVTRTDDANVVVVQFAGPAAQPS